MTNKITIQFNEIEEQKQKTVKKLIEKPYDHVTQQDLLDVRNVLNHHHACHDDTDEQKQMMERLLNMQLDSRLYKPIDQRSFIQYVTDIIYDWVHENLDYGVSTFNSYDVFDSYYADGTMTYNTQETLNYIRSFWDEFQKKYPEKYSNIEDYYSDIESRTRKVGDNEPYFDPRIVMQSISSQGMELKIVDYGPTYNDCDVDYSDLPYITISTKKRKRP